MAYKLQLKRGASGSLPTGSAGEPLFTTDTNDLYIGTGASNQRYQKYIASGTSSQFIKGDGSLDSNTYYLASNPSAYIPLTALTASSPLSYNNTTGAFTIQVATDSQNGYLSSSDRTVFNNKQDQFSPSSPLSFSGSNLIIAQSSATTNGYLSSTDWTTFNNKQNALTNPVTGTGTTNYLPKWTSGSAIGNSIVSESGTIISVAGSVSIQSDSSYYRIKRAVGTDVGYITDSTTWGDSGTDFTIGASSSNLRFYVNNNILERMRLTSIGNLLVGTTTDAGYKLNVNGTGRFVSSNNTTPLTISAGSNATFEFKGNSTSGYAATFNINDYALYIGHNSSLRDLVLQTASVDRLTISGSGAATFSSSVTATSFIKTGGTSSQYLMADGSVTTGGGGGGSVDELQVSLICQVFG